jgi:hypothetical protein
MLDIMNAKLTAVTTVNKKIEKGKKRAFCIVGCHLTLNLEKHILSVCSSVFQPVAGCYTDMSVQTCRLFLCVTQY